MKKSKEILLCKLLFLGLLLLRICLCLFHPAVSKYVGNEKRIEGTIESYQWKENSLSFVVKGKEKVQCFYETEDDKELEKIQSLDLYGAKVILEGNLVLPTHARIPNTFDYQKYLYYRGIHYLFYVSEFSFQSSTSQVILKLKNTIEKRIEMHSFKVSAYLKTFLLGNKSAIEEDVSASFLQNGISHLFAISGMHISFLALFLQKLFCKLKVPFKVQFVFFCFFLGFYSYLTGFAASSIRSVLLFLILFWKKIYHKPWKSTSVLLVIAYAMLFYHPFYVYDIGFLYSFLITYALLKMPQKKVGFILGLLKTSVVAFLWGMPIALFTNFEINLLSPIRNLYFVPIVSFFLFPLAFLVFLFPFPFLSKGYLILIHLLERGSLFVSNYGISFSLAKYSLIVYIFLYFILLWGFHQKKGYLFLFLFLLVLKILPYMDANSYVYFLDVGQGDATVLVSPYHLEVIMIDTGGLQNKTEYDAKNIATFLKSKGIKKIHHIFLTHGDFDHAGNVISLNHEISIDAVSFNQGEKNALEKSIAELLPEKKVPKFLQFHIKEWTHASFNTENEDSRILEVNINHATLLFMGDASKKVEEYYLAVASKVSLFHVSHHGSSTSNSFSLLKKIQPMYAINSSGKKNSYHHPSPKTIETLEILNIPYKDTQYDDTILLKITKNGDLIFL